MLARLRKSAEKNEQGFTLIELLVVMIIIGILAAIAVPVFLSQRAKARDTAVKSDVSTLGKEISAYYVDNTAAPTVTVTGAGRYLVNATDAGKVSDGVTLVTTTTAIAAWTPTTWCISLTNANGSQKNYKYSAADGLATGTC